MSDNTAHQYAVILAGGHGKRLWPLSTDRQPKQFRRLNGRRPMILQTFERLASCVPAANIFVSTTSAHVEEVLAAIPDLDPNRLIVEPYAAGKPAAFLLTAYRISEVDPDAVVLSSASDTFVAPLDAFQASCAEGFAFVQEHPDWLGMFGSRPDRPDTSMGYVRASELAMETPGVHVAKDFHEKPTGEQAAGFVADHEYFWNSSHYFFSARRLIDSYRQADPAWADEVQGYAQRVQGATYPRRGGPPHELTAFHDGGVQIGVVPVDFGWHDLGTWTSLHRALTEAEPTGVVTSGPSIIDTGSKASIVFNESSMTVVTAGLEGLAVVVSDSVVFVAPVDELEDDDDLMSRLRSRYEALEQSDDREK